MTDYKQLCAELAEDLALWLEYDGPPSSLPIEEGESRKLLARARAELAKPEPEWPTDEELLATAAASIEPCQDTGIAFGEYELETEGAVEMYGSELIAFARAALARWGK